jgi:hypothetical protein
MPLSISSSELRPLWVFVATLLILAGAWEMVIRGHYSPPVDVLDAQIRDVAQYKDRRWIVFGNCLVLNGVSPARMESTWRRQLGGEDTLPVVLNISQHEHSPLAYFLYLKQAGYYPEVIMANISSWLNGSNFEVEAAQLVAEDPLRLFSRPRAASTAGAKGKDAMSLFTTRVEYDLVQTLDDWIKQSGKRYHLFDYAIFLAHLARTGNLRDSLYQLNLQSWFTVTGTEVDGRGFLGLRVNYDDDWTRGQDVMADKQILRIRAGNFLTERYWSQLEVYVREFRTHGTRIVLMRMPEHPQIRALNDEIYRIPERLAGIAQRNAIEILDFRDKLTAPVQLFDAVHPDYPASIVISEALAKWVADYHHDWLSRARPDTGVAR